LNLSRDRLERIECLLDATRLRRPIPPKCFQELEQFAFIDALDAAPGMLILTIEQSGQQFPAGAAARRRQNLSGLWSSKAFATDLYYVEIAENCNRL
jgi:hypothetical protein